MMTDIIIPSFNQEDLTIACIRSIKKHTKKGTYRVIWVDNGSDNPDRVLSILRGVDKITILLESNKGFVGAVNEGLKVSTAETVCLLNNDTEVSSRWLEKLTDILYSEEKLGIIGACTENHGCGGEDCQHNIKYQAQIRPMPPFDFATVDWLTANNYVGAIKSIKVINPYFDLEDYNRKLEAMYSGIYGAPTGFVPFLCAVIKREVIDVVGLLDENFELGLYDDNDYCHQAERLGFKLALALDTCIYHRGRSTFNELALKEGLDVPAMLTKNHAYMQKKWSGE